MKIDFKFVTDENGEKKLHTYKDKKLLSSFSTSEDKEGHVYGFVPNVNAPEDKKIYKHRMTIKDKIEQIKNGYGDAILVSNFMFRSEHLVYFEDRAYGELIRYKSMQEFKDTKFGHCITMWHPIETRAVGKDGYTCRVCDSENLLIFDTKEAAQSYIDDAKVIAEKLYNDYEKINESNEEETNKFFNYVYNNHNLAVVSAFDNIFDYKRKNEGCIDPSRFFGITDCIIAG